jgi:cytochrome b
MLKTIRVWDLPTRLFHWALVLCIVGLVTTSQIGGNAMIWHFRFGYSVLSLLLFRIVWGFMGGRWSRFASFIYSPGTVLRYLRGQGRPEHSVGHNPLGAGSVFAMLFVLLAQVGTGLLADDEIANAGPLTKFVTDTVISQATRYHKSWGKYALLLLVSLHILAILFYVLKKRQNLVRPMVVGDKEVASHTLESAKDNTRSRIVAAIVFAVCVVAVAAMVQFAG